jgi:hypothetical protein
MIDLPRTGESLMKRPAKILAAMALALGPLPTAHAGDDLWGKVTGVQIAAGGKLWFSMTAASGTTAPSTYCKPGWAGLNLYVPQGPRRVPVLLRHADDRGVEGQDGLGGQCQHL